jgi:hypothetical protein
MTILAAFRDAVSKRQDGEDSCIICVHYCDDPVRIEQELRGLSAFSSAHASVRARDGLCLLHDLVINGRGRCAALLSKSSCSGQHPDGGQAS